jgi:hypothetical protein
MRKHAPWYVTDFLFPLLPFFIQLFIRWLFLGSRIRWWLVPDVATLLITVALFCLFIQKSLTSAPRIDSDDEVKERYARTVERFGHYALWCSCFFGIVTTLNVLDIASHSETLALFTGYYLFIMSCVTSVFIFVDAVFSSRRFVTAA